MHRIDTGSFLEDPLRIHARNDLLVRAKQEPEEIARRLKTDFVFTFVRNPLSRGYSCFNEKIVHVGPYSIRKGRSATERFGADFSGELTLEKHQSNFKAFLRLVQASTSDAALRNAHWLPQTTIFCRSVFPLRMPNFIGKVENLTKEMSFVLGIVGSDFDMSTLPRMNEGPPAPYKLDEIVDDEIIELAKVIYRADLTNFGYQL